MCENFSNPISPSQDRKDALSRLEESSDIAVLFSSRGDGSVKSVLRKETLRGTIQYDHLFGIDKRLSFGSQLLSTSFITRLIQSKLASSKGRSNKPWLPTDPFAAQVAFPSCLWPCDCRDPRCASMALDYSPHAAELFDICLPFLLVKPRRNKRQSLRCKSKQVPRLKMPTKRKLPPRICAFPPWR